MGVKFPKKPAPPPETQVDEYEIDYDAETVICTNEENEKIKTLM